MASKIASLEAEIKEYEKERKEASNDHELKKVLLEAITAKNRILYCLMKQQNGGKNVLPLQPTIFLL